MNKPPKIVRNKWLDTLYHRCFYTKYNTWTFENDRNIIDADKWDEEEFAGKNVEPISRRDSFWYGLLFSIISVLVALLLWQFPSLISYYTSDNQGIILPVVHKFVARPAS